MKNLGLEFRLALLGSAFGEMSADGRSPTGLKTDSNCAAVHSVAPLLTGKLDPVGGNADDTTATWARTGFDLKVTPEAACRGRCVGLVNNRIKQIS